MNSPWINPAPCREKQCWFCCNPVKIRMGRWIEIPKDSEGNSLWEKREWIYASVKKLDTDRLVFYTCKKFDSLFQQCSDYDNRPEICRVSSCIRSDDQKPFEEQFLEVIQTSFIRIR